MSKRVLSALRLCNVQRVFDGFFGLQVSLKMFVVLGGVFKTLSNICDGISVVVNPLNFILFILTIGSRYGIYVIDEYLFSLEESNWLYLQWMETVEIVYKSWLNSKEKY